MAGESVGETEGDWVWLGGVSEEEGAFELSLALDDDSFGSCWTVFCRSDEPSDLGLCRLLSALCRLGLEGTVGFIATGGTELLGGLLKEPFTSSLDSFSSQTFASCLTPDGGDLAPLLGCKSLSLCTFLITGEILGLPPLVTV